MFSFFMAALPLQAQEVYVQNFENPADPLVEWSNPNTDVTPGTDLHPPDRFLGQFGNTQGSPITLTLTDLPAHAWVMVSFDVYVIRTMDGNGPYGGPDGWSAAWALDESGPAETLLYTTFSNNWGTHTQDYPAEYGHGNYPAGEGAFETNTLGYVLSVPRDSVYRFPDAQHGWYLRFEHAASTLVLRFTSYQNQQPADESWGVDNVVVTIAPDCNGNGIPDDCDLSCAGQCGVEFPTSCGQSVDCNENGVPDEWELTTAGEWTYLPHNSHSYRLSPAPGFWADGEAEAVCLGGHLATIRDAVEDQWICEALAVPGQDVFMGLHQPPGSEEPAGGWTWLTDDPVIYTNWSPGEPNDWGDGEDCAVMCYSGTEAWADYPCADEESMYQGVIERDGIPPADCNDNGTLDECDLGEYYFVTEWGELGTEPGQFHNPYGMAVDSRGFVYVCDHSNNRVQKFYPDGTLFGEPWPTEGMPHSIAIYEPEGSSGDCYAYVSLFFLESGGHGYRVLKFTCAGDRLPEGDLGADHVGGGDGEFDSPAGVAVDAEGCVYVSDWSNRLQKFCDLNQEEPLDFVCSSGGFSDPYGVALDQDGRVMVCDTMHRRIVFLDGDDCEYLHEWDMADVLSGFGPSWIAVDSAGDVYVTDTDLTPHQVMKFAADTSERTLLTSWGPWGSGPGEFQGSTGIAVDNAGNVYVGDQLPDRIQKFRDWSDCNNNGILDECDMADCDGSYWCEDCNNNGILDGCEPDFDGDHVIDDCDDDVDDDGVLNDDDVCDYTPHPLPPGAVLQPDGTLRGDIDGDCDCDLEDFAILQADFTGPARP